MIVTVVLGDGYWPRMLLNTLQSQNSPLAALPKEVYGPKSVSSATAGKTVLP